MTKATASWGLSDSAMTGPSGERAPRNLSQNHITQTELAADRSGCAPDRRGVTTCGAGYLPARDRTHTYTASAARSIRSITTLPRCGSATSTT